MLYLFQRPRLPWERRWWPLVMIIFGLGLGIIGLWFGYNLFTTGWIW